MEATALDEYLDLLGLQEQEHVGLFWKRGDEKHTAVLPCSAVPSAIARLDDTYDIYLAPNPTAGPARLDQGRGKETDVTRVLAVYADLDIKPGACPDFEAAIALTKDINGLIGTEPVATIFSGKGIQPVWRLEDCSPDTGRKLLKRFGRLVKVVAAARDMTVDSVFDTARILRVPGTLNHKYEHPIQTALIVGRGAPMTPDELDERLNEAGVLDLGDDSELSEHVIAYPEESTPAAETCPYMVKAIETWDTEPIADRHPWLLCQFVRLECARRNSCLTEADYQRAINVLIRRFERECARPGDTRSVKRLEISDIREEAHSRASRKTDEQIRGELGGTGHFHPWRPVLVVTEPEVQQQITEIIPGLIEAEGDFWNSRVSLKTVYETALARMCSPWAVLACCVARALAYVRPNAKLPSLVGSGGGSLNWFAALAAASGGGKSMAMSAARDLVGVHIEQRNVGSGEGLLDAYSMKDKEGNIGVRESLLFSVDEIDMLYALKNRTGSTLLGFLKSAFTGVSITPTYANRKYPELKDHSYRLVLLCAVQPGKAGWIFEDSSGGMPQRFMWFPGVDARIHEDFYQEQHFGYSLELPEFEEYRYPRDLMVPPEAKSHILKTRASAARGDEMAGLDSHAMFAREKMAYGLAVLDGRVTMNLQDWELSGIAARVSALTRDWVIEGIRTERHRDATERGEYQGTMRAVAEESKLAYSTQRAERVMSLVLAKIREAGKMTDRDLRNSFASRDRNYVAAALSNLAEQSMIRAESAGPKGGTMWCHV